MKFSILSDYLYDHLQVVARVINAKPKLAIMEFVLFELRGDELFLTATDGETRVVTSLELSDYSGEHFDFCVRARQLIDPLKEIPNQLIEFDLEEESMELSAKYNNGFFSFPVIKGEDFPEREPISDESLSFNINVTALVEGLENTIYATSTDEVRPIMMGVHMDIRPEHVTFVGTNGFLLSYYRHSALGINVSERTSITLQKKPALLLSQLLSKEAEVAQVKVELYHNFAVFQSQTIRLECRLLEGKYPNYETVIPPDNDKVLEADRIQLLAATRRVSVFASKGLNLVSFDFAPTKLTLKANDMDFSTKAEEVLPVSFSAEQAKFSFKADHLIEILGVLESDEVIMKIGDASRAALISPVGGEVGVEIVVAVMPFVYG